MAQEDKPLQWIYVQDKGLKLLTSKWDLYNCVYLPQNIRLLYYIDDTILNGSSEQELVTTHMPSEDGT